VRGQGLREKDGLLPDWSSAPLNQSPDLSSPKMLLTSGNAARMQCTSDPCGVAEALDAELGPAVCATPQRWCLQIDRNTAEPSFPHCRRRARSLPHRTHPLKCCRASMRIPTFPLALAPNQSHADEGVPLIFTRNCPLLYVHSSGRASLARALR